MSQNVFRQSAALPANVACCRQAPVGAAGRLLAVAGRALWAGSGGPWPAAPARLPAGLEGVAEGPVRPARTLRGDLSSRAAPPCWVRRERAWRRPCVLLVCVPGSPLGLCALCHRKMVQTHLAPSPPWPWDRRQTPFSRRQSGVRTGSRTCAPLSGGAAPGPARRGAGGRPGVHTHTGTFVCVFASACVERREFRDASGSGPGSWPPASFLFPRCSSFPTEAW